MGTYVYNVKKKENHHSLSEKEGYKHIIPASMYMRDISVSQFSHSHHRPVACGACVRCVRAPCGLVVSTGVVDPSPLQTRQTRASIPTKAWPAVVGYAAPPGGSRCTEILSQATMGRGGGEGRRGAVWWYIRRRGLSFYRFVLPPQDDKDWNWILDLRVFICGVVCNLFYCCCCC